MKIETIDLYTLYFVSPLILILVFVIGDTWNGYTQNDSYKEELCIRYGGKVTIDKNFKLTCEK